jgi:hypothetical protein
MNTGSRDEARMLTNIERMAVALEQIARSLEKLANPMVSITTEEIVAEPLAAD